MSIYALINGPCPCIVLVYVQAFSLFMLLSPFLWCIMASPKKSSSFNMFSTSPIIFIKCRNRDHMKNNIRYKGNTNNTSVIIFFNCRTKTPSDVTLLGRTAEEVFMMLLFFISFLYLHFIFDLNFVVVFLHSHLLFDVIPHPCVDYRRVFIPIYTFRPAHRRVIRHNFINQPFRYLLAASATALSGHFLPKVFFTLCSFTDILTCVYQGFPGSWQFFLEVCRALYGSPNTDPAHLLV